MPYILGVSTLGGICLLLVAVIVKQETIIYKLRKPKPTSGYRLAIGLFNRWYIVHPLNDTLAWSGSRWVRLDGDVQSSNFASEQDAREYADKIFHSLTH